MAITDDPQCFATDFVTVFGLFVPYPKLTQLESAIEILARESDELRHDEFSDGTGVGEGRVEDGDASLSGSFEIDLIYTDTEASNDQKLHSEKTIRNRTEKNKKNELWKRLKSPDSSLSFCYGYQGHDSDRCSEPILLLKKRGRNDRHGNPGLGMCERLRY